VKKEEGASSRDRREFQTRRRTTVVDRDEGGAIEAEETKAAQKTKCPRGKED